jgi:7,8-dihydropterin-6-yl-methyl-4-(beta-D-ribofuranosyl)aminobenzene 5'-phosphate synthase
MVIRDGEQLVVFTGCAHRGILNMVDTVTKQFRDLPIKAVFGGFHLMAGNRREIEDIGRRMLKYPVEKAYTGHCTGLKAYRGLKDIMGGKLEYLPTGASVEV